MPINETISAAIYIGAYTAQMLIARMLPNGTSFETINQFTTFTDMALDRTEDGLLSDAGMKRVLDALREFHETARLEGVSTFYVAATSSLRKVPNRSLLLLGCQREFGTFPRLLSGRDELRLNFAGAVTDAMANLPVIVTYVGYSNFCFSYGTASTIDGAVELDLGVSKVDRHFKRRRHLTLFRQIALHRYVTKKLSGLSADYRKWRSNLAVEPEFMAVGPLSFGCLSLLTKHSVYESVDSIAAIPQKTAALVELSRNLVARSKESVTGLPGIDRQIAPTIASGAMILRCALELTGSYEFRVTPYGICAGMLRSPSYLFTQTNI